MEVVSIDRNLICVGTQRKNEKRFRVKKYRSRFFIVVTVTRKSMKLKKKLQNSSLYKIVSFADFCVIFSVALKN